MDPVDEPDPILAQVGQTRPGGVGVVKQKHPSEGGQAVVDLAVRGLHAIREGSEETGERDEDEEEKSQRTCDRVTRTVVGKDGCQELEGEEGSCREEIRQVGGAR